MMLSTKLGPMAKTIEFHEVSFSYDDLPVLRNANFTLQGDDFVAILGPNGGGKTTIAKLMLGLLRPTRGSILVSGKPATEAGKCFGYVPQYAQFDPRFPISVEETVMSGLLDNRPGFFRSAHRERASAAMEAVGIADLRHRGFEALSGGQRQRVLIARALVTDPEYLLLDEPTANVDTATENKLYGLLLDLRKRTTVLTITHDLGFVSDAVTKVLCVNRDVHLHPTAAVTPDLLAKLFGTKVRAVLHDVHEEECCG